METDRQVSSIQINLTREQAELLLAPGATVIPGLAESYEISRAHGFLPVQTIKFFMSDTVACGVVRSNDIVSAVNRFAKPHRGDCKAVTTPSDIESMTCAVIQRQRHPRLASFLKETKSYGKRLVYDIDDDLFNVPPELGHVYKTYADPEVQKAIKDIMLSCDEVIAATPYLADEVSRQLEDQVPVRVVPNYIDLTTWRPVLPKVQEPLIIGWMASGTHSADCQLMESVMPAMRQEFGDKVLVEIIGNVDPSMLGKWQINYTQLPWTPYKELPAIMSRWSVGLCPLRDTKFNRSKSSLKALQYWGLRVPIICSDVEPYRRTVESGVDGFLVTGDREWRETLLTLLKDVDLRTRLADNGYRKVAAQFDLKNKVWDRIQAAAGR